MSKTNITCDILRSLQTLNYLILQGRITFETKDCKADGVRNCQIDKDLTVCMMVVGFFGSPESGGNRISAFNISECRLRKARDNPEFSPTEYLYTK